MKVFLYDTGKCTGCYQCQIACKDEHCGNDWTPYAKPQPETGQFWLKVTEYVRGTVPKVKVHHIVRLCQHCDNAPCIDVCPAEAIYRRDDGLVIIDPKKCDGCQLCLEACPYGVIYFNQGLKLAQKCTGCAHLLDRGYPITEPRCTDACIPGALLYGEESALDTTGAETLNPEYGLTTNVFYKNLPKKFIAGTVYDSSTMEIVEGATCTLSGTASGTVTTDGFGDFWFEGLTDGTYSLAITATGYSA
jgi:Fe-S-cluster-containing dehydrogenase component